MKIATFKTANSIRYGVVIGYNIPKRHPTDNTPMPPPENIILFAKLDE